jgi:putative ABC transport system permease protein
MHPMSEVIADSLWLKRISADLIGLLAICGLVLAATGIYGISSYAAAQRKKEMGIRMAFGADRYDVFGLVMKETCRLAIAGSFVGCMAAAVVARVATNISYLSLAMAATQSRYALDPRAFVLSSLFLFIVAATASYAPPDGPSTRTRQRSCNTSSQSDKVVAETSAAEESQLLCLRSCDLPKVQSM